MVVLEGASAPRVVDGERNNVRSVNVFCFDMAVAPPPLLLAPPPSTNPLGNPDQLVLLENGLVPCHRFGEEYQIPPLTLASNVMAAVYYKRSRKNTSWHVCYGPTRSDQIHKGILDVFDKMLGKFFFLDIAPSWKENRFTGCFRDFVRSNLQKALNGRSHLPPLKVLVANVLVRNPDNVALTREWDRRPLSNDQIAMYFNFKAPRDTGAQHTGWFCYLVLELAEGWREHCAEQISVVCSRASPTDAPTLRQGVFRLKPGMRKILQTLPDMDPMRCTFTEAEVCRSFIRSAQRPN
jgi:hypothetical protein